METKPSKIVIIISVILMVINSYFAYLLGGGSIGYVAGFVFALPLLIIAISSIFKVYRNWRSRWFIIFNTMLVTSLAIFGNLLSMADKLK
ncbi:hypothetical protein [Sulfurovum sp.]|uniref:hypothetical protein n=1 Tax=Sulfurovum sp. TaxID=1969726 RepID=UPI002A36219B|nr:hypothetical protein [Sulfurovum sp.]MDD2452136.1 hypothetical protein [Sulfurovum sp.]MDD3500211.1 hypothetical protein [Sulfurovum sp.]MDY0402492.1 hypothetical protein [Sulfurovum sp.]